MEIFGIVQREPTLIENCCVFPLEGKDGLYLILSTDGQAVKDHIFVNEGQKMHLMGKAFILEEMRGVFVIEQAKIQIGKEIIPKK